MIFQKTSLDTCIIFPGTQFSSGSFPCAVLKTETTKKVAYVLSSDKAWDGLAILRAQDEHQANESQTKKHTENKTRYMQWFYLIHTLLIKWMRFQSS